MASWCLVVFYLQRFICEWCSFCRDGLLFGIQNKSWRINLHWNMAHPPPFFFGPSWLWKANMTRFPEGPQTHWVQMFPSNCLMTLQFIQSMICLCNKRCNEEEGSGGLEITHPNICIYGQKNTLWTLFWISSNYIVVQLCHFLIAVRNFNC